MSVRKTARFDIRKNRVSHIAERPVRRRIESKIGHRQRAIEAFRGTPLGEHAGRIEHAEAFRGTSLMRDRPRHHISIAAINAASLIPALCAASSTDKMPSRTRLISICKAPSCRPSSLPSAMPSSLPFSSPSL